MTPSDPRWRRRKDDRPSEIIFAALEVFSERGFSATRLDDVAAKAGVTKGTLYLYFQSKEELFKAVVRHFIVATSAAREETIAKSTAPTADLLRNIFMSLPFIQEGAPAPVIPKLIIAEAQNFPDLARFYFEEVLSRWRHQVRGLVKRGIARGEFRPIDPTYVHYSIIGPVMTAVLWQTVFLPYDDEPLNLRKAFETHVDILLNGLLKSSGGDGK